MLDKTTNGDFVYQVSSDVSSLGTDEHTSAVKDVEESGSSEVFAFVYVDVFIVADMGRCSSANES